MEDESILCFTDHLDVSPHNAHVKWRYSLIHQCLNNVAWNGCEDVTNLSQQNSRKVNSSPAGDDKHGGLGVTARHYTVTDSYSSMWWRAT